jgi:thioredoxin reductase (NADPH)
MSESIPDLLIVGAGPAGISAALWAASLDLRPLLLEAAPSAGGQLHRIHFEPKNLAAATPGTGAALAARASDQLISAGIDVRTGVDAIAIETPPGARGPLVHTGAGTLGARSVVVATGLRRRRLGVPGERELEGRGVSESATRDLERLRGRDVTVIGGGDAAFENALLLAGAGCRVALAVRGPVHARAAFRARAAAHGAITILNEARATAILGGEAVEAVRFDTPDGPIEHATSAVVVKVGQVPNTKWCRTLARDGEGYLRVDAELRTSMPRVWAAGDVTHPRVPGIAVALGHGAAVAAAIRAALDGEQAEGGQGHLASGERTR